jgi:hypothetical protein
MTNTSLHAARYLSLPPACQSEAAGRRKRESIFLDSSRLRRDGNDDASTVGKLFREADICINAWLRTFNEA